MTTHDRKYLDEMNIFIREMIDKAVIDSPNNSFVNSDLAAEIVTHLRKYDPDLLNGWINVRLVSLISEHITGIQASDRAHNAKKAASGAFRKWTEAGRVDANGHLTYPEQTPWNNLHAVDENNTRKPSWALTRDDCLYVAGEFSRQSRTTAMEAAFFGAVAKKLHGDQRVIDRFSQEEYLALFNRMH